MDYSLLVVLPPVHVLLFFCGYTVAFSFHLEHSCPEYILCDVVYLLAHHPCMESVDETSNLAIQEYVTCTCIVSKNIIIYVSPEFKRLS